MRRTSFTFEMRSLIHCSAPFRVGLPDDFAKTVLRGEDLANIGCCGDRRVIDIVEQELARLQVAVQHSPKHARRIHDVRRKPDTRCILGLLLRGDGRRPFHRTRASQAANGLLCSEFASLADFPLKILVGEVLRAVFLAHAFGNSELTSSLGTVGAFALQLFAAPLTTSLISLETSPRLLLPGFMPVSTSWNATP